MRQTDRERENQIDIQSGIQRDIQRYREICTYVNMQRETMIQSEGQT